jgi:hypothetical protein
VKNIGTGSKTQRAVERPIADAESKAPGSIRARSIDPIERHRLVRFGGTALYGQDSSFVAGMIYTDRRTRVGCRADQSKTGQDKSRYQSRPEARFTTRS